MTGTLRVRLALWTALGLGAFLLLLGGAAFWILDRGLRANVDASLASVAEVIVESRRDPARLRAEALREWLGPAFENLYRFLDPGGEPRPEGAPSPGPSFPLGEEARRNAARGLETYETIRFPAAGEGSIRLLTKPVVDGGRVVNLVQVGMPLDAVEAARRQLLLVLLGLAPLALGGVALGGWLLAGRALAPVGAMAETARRINAEDLSRRLPVDAADEIGRLASIVNEMLARLERSFSAARSFGADAAHELRTPLTIFKGEIEVALRTLPAADPARATLESCLEEVERMGALVEDLLFLARTDAGAVTPPRETVNLVELIDDARPAIAALAERGGVAVEVRASPGAAVRGSAAMLFRVLLNLAENAIRHSGRGHRVEIAATRSGDDVRLEVRDDGPGIPPEERERIFERFHRVGASRGEGSGLGLSIVRSIVVLHGGSIELESGAGGGSLFRVRLPAAAEPAEG